MEKINRFFELLISVIVEELDLDIRSLGATTFKLEKSEKGVEPNGYFYLQSAEKIVGNDKVDLEVDPPTDLTIEIDVTNPSLDRFPIYASFSVCEIRRYFDEKVEIFRLTEKNT